VASLSVAAEGSGVVGAVGAGSGGGDERGGRADRDELGRRVVTPDREMGSDRSSSAASLSAASQAGSSALSPLIAPTLLSSYLTQNSDIGAECSHDDLPVHTVLGVLESNITGQLNQLRRAQGRDFL
jgi:hypothetical protein